MTDSHFVEVTLGPGILNSRHEVHLYLRSSPGIPLDVYFADNQQTSVYKYTDWTVTSGSNSPSGWKTINTPLAGQVLRAEVNGTTDLVTVSVNGVNASGTINVGSGFSNKGFGYREVGFGLKRASSTPHDLNIIDSWRAGDL